MSSPTTFVALLRGINVGGGNRIPMAELRAVCAEIGWGDVLTYIASGNVVFRAEGTRIDIEDRLEDAILRRFGLAIPVIARARSEWSGYASTNPFPEAAASEPNKVLLAVSKEPGPAGALDLLLERAAGGERITRAGDVFWLHFTDGVAGSKVFPGMLDRVIGSPVTTRNWRTVLKLEELARSVSDEA